MSNLKPESADSSRRVLGTSRFEASRFGCESSYPKADAKESSFSKADCVNLVVLQKVEIKVRKKR